MQSSHSQIFQQEGVFTMCTTVKLSQNWMICSKTVQIYWTSCRVLYWVSKPGWIILCRLYAVDSTCWIIGGQRGDHRVFHKLYENANIGIFVITAWKQKKIQWENVTPVGIEPRPPTTSDSKSNTNLH